VDSPIDFSPTDLDHGYFAGLEKGTEKPGPTSEQEWFGLFSFLDLNPFLPRTSGEKGI
jgi:hypothetical protein